MTPPLWAIPASVPSQRNARGTLMFRFCRRTELPGLAWRSDREKTSALMVEWIASSPRPPSAMHWLKAPRADALIVRIFLTKLEVWLMSSEFCLLIRLHVASDAADECCPPSENGPKPTLPPISLE